MGIQAKPKPLLPLFVPSNVPKKVLFQSVAQL